MKYAIILLTFLCYLPQVSFGQLDRLSSYKQQLQKDTILNSILFRNIGPTIMSGRAVDIEVNPNNTTEFYVAYASGGVWHSTNNGMSFTPIFDKEATITVGDIAVDWTSGTIWVGTGECNSSRSSYAGLGIYSSVDTGKHWIHKGLETTQHISKILIDAKNNTIYVASIGPLYSIDKTASGLFVSKNNGDSWKHIMFKDGDKSIGIIDLVIDNNNSSHIIATTWDRSRQAYQFNGEGIGSAIYESNNAGENWQCISGKTSGFPKNERIGRIGIAQCNTKPNVWYALLDNQNRQEKSNKIKTDLTALEIKDMDEQTFMNKNDNVINLFLKANGFPEKYNAKNIKEDLKLKKYSVKAIADWVLSDGGASLFQTPVIGAELYKSIDAGKTWNKTHNNILEGLYFTYGYYFGTISVNPKNENDVYIAGYTALKSEDGGKTFKEIVGENCHPDHHRVWINPKEPKHVILCNDGGINITYDDGKNWNKANNPAVGQFYAIAVDNATPYKVYGGLQDNGTWVGPSNYIASNSWQQNGTYPYKEIGGGDGMQIQIDTRDNETVYTGYQFGYYQRANINDDKKESIEIHPNVNIGEKPLRWNWQTPIYLSKHNQDILYMGSNFFHRSMNKGADMKTLGTDLTNPKTQGNVPFGTITSIHESEKIFGLIYCGTDDGLLWKSIDVGNHFTTIQSPVKNLWCSRIIASKHHEQTIYVAFNGYRQDDFKPYLYISNNGGKTWEFIGSSLPNEPINVIREDAKNEQIIYVGTDNGLYVSFDKGNHFIPWLSNLPRVAIHDIAIQERENEIVLGTHGRSIYIGKLDHIQLVDSLQKRNQLSLFMIPEIVASKNWGSAWASYAKVNEPEIEITIFSPNATNAEIQILKDKKVIHQFKQLLHKGFNTIPYNGRISEINKNNLKYSFKGNNDQYYLTANQYKVNVICGNEQQGKVLTVINKK